MLVGRMTEEQRRRFPAGVELVERTENVGKLAALYASATVLVNPTWQDNYVVEQGDVDGMLARVREFAAADRALTTARCREYALQHFGKTKCYKNYIQLYEDLTIG